MTEQLSESKATGATRLRNILIALAAIALSVAIFLGVQGKTSTASLQAQAQASVPLAVALSNGKPTLTEFYADWCTSCRAMAKDLAEIKQQYEGKVNFVMLNVDNNKWLPEILRYRVDGIPHFVFFNRQGEEIAQTIGEQPLPILEADLEALVADLPLPYAYSTGQVSKFSTPVNPATPPQDDPRSHGTQVNQS
jgi:thiol-disulfide isomerase/thioredoxin